MWIFLLKKAVTGHLLLSDALGGKKLSHNISKEPQKHACATNGSTTALNLLWLDGDRCLRIILYHFPGMVTDRKGKKR